ncbi:CCN family member 4-like isoform X2 [Lampetra fluviatilis]
MSSRHRPSRCLPPTSLCLLSVSTPQACMVGAFVGNMTGTAESMVESSVTSSTSSTSSTTSSSTTQIPAALAPQAPQAPQAPSNELHPSERRQFCEWPCRCPALPPRCPPGVSLVTDGCGCCKTCARQGGERCTEADTCDYHRGLYCDYSGDRPRYEIGVCAYIIGVGCRLNGEQYQNGQTFQQSCRYRCTCVNGAIGCVPVCTHESRPPLVWCQRPRRVAVPGKCCERWVCDDIRAKIRKSVPKHLALAVFRDEREEDTLWRSNCLVQTTSWSPCSETCGLGISTRITNHNAACSMNRERRLCYVRPCETNGTHSIREGRSCQREYRSRHPVRLELSGCTSVVSYLFKFCGGCRDGRCCDPYRTATISAEFTCPDGTRTKWQLMWINSCRCHRLCRNPNDIFADLGNHDGFNGIEN